jgi:cyanophycinase
MNNAPQIRCRCIVLVAAALVAPSWLLAQSGPTPENLGETFRPVSGALVIVGGGIIPAEITDRFLELGGGEKTRLVVVTTASIYAGTPEMDARMDSWREKTLKSLTVLHTRSRDEANDPNFYRPITEATAVWFIGGNQNWLTEAYLGTRTEAMLRELLDRGGVIGGTSAGAAVMSRVMIAGGKETPLLKNGFGFAPAMIVDQHFKKRNRQQRLIDALQQHPGLVGMGIDESTALVIRGSRAEVIGQSDVTITLPAANGRPARTESLSPGRSADLYALNRAAKSRKIVPQVAKPSVRNGTLLLVGDGDVPDEVEKQFLVAAGGNDAPIVVVCESIPDGDEEHVICRRLRTAGAVNVKLLPAGSREDVEAEDFLAELAAAKGIWLSNGPIRRLIDTYVDSPAQTALARLLDQGGVIAGSAAAAALQTATVCHEPTDDELGVISEAYECGFGFLPGVALANRDRQADPKSGLKARYPHLIGVELQDSTALIVRGSKMWVLGKHAVTVLDRRPDDAEDHPEFSLVNPGEAYDLAERSLLVDLEEEATTR